MSEPVDRPGDGHPQCADAIPADAYAAARTEVQRAREAEDRIRAHYRKRRPHDWRYRPVK